MSFKQILNIFETNENRVAKHLKIDSANVYTWSNGKVKMPQKRQKQIAELFNVDEDFLVKDLTKKELIILKLRFMKEQHGMKNEEFQQMVKEGVSVD